MASGPYWNPDRGTWSVQWNDGYRWCRPTVVKKRPGWKRGDPPPKKTPPEAIAALAEYTRREREAKLRRPIDPQRGVREFLDDFHAGYRGSRAEGSAHEVAKASRVFLDWCDENSIARLDQVTSAICHRWMDDRAKTIAKRSGKPIEHATMKKERALLARAWSEAVRREEVPSNPWVSVEVPGKPPKGDRGAWSKDDLEKLLSESNLWLRDLLTIGCHTGLRIDALKRLEWSDIKWSEEGDVSRFGFVVVRPDLDKAKKGYRVPISRACHDVLMRRWVGRDADATYVLTGFHGRRIKQTSVTANAIVRACRRAGLKKPASPNHHMRRTFGRFAVYGHLTGRPIPLYVVSKWMGHSTVKMTEHYLNLDPDESAHWMEEVATEALPD